VSKRFNRICTYALLPGITHNLGASPTTGLWSPKTNVLTVLLGAPGCIVDSICASGRSGAVILLWNPSQTLSLELIDKDNALFGGAQGCGLALPNPNGLAANAITGLLPPQSGQKFTYYSLGGHWIQG
jgi:hypothetical protein